MLAFEQLRKVIMAKFRCKQTKNVFQFDLEHDIKNMRTHPDYEEVFEQEEDKEQAAKRSVGRPPKNKE